MKKFGLVLLALAAPFSALAAEPSGSASDADAQAPQPRAAADQSEPAETEARLICRRTQHTGQRTAARRVCRTAAQWREIDR